MILLFLQAWQKRIRDAIISVYPSRIGRLEKLLLRFKFSMEGDVVEEEKELRIKQQVLETNRFLAYVYYS